MRTKQFDAVLCLSKKIFDKSNFFGDNDERHKKNETKEFFVNLERKSSFIEQTDAQLKWSS